MKGAFPSQVNFLGVGMTLILFILILLPLLSVLLQIVFPGFFFGHRVYSGFSQLLDIFNRPLWSHSLKNSLILAAGTGLCGTILGGTLALVRTRWSFKTAKLLGLAVWLLLITPSFILAQGWILFAGSAGIASQALGWDWVNTVIFRPSGLILIMTLSKFSLAYLAVAAALEWNVSKYEDAARLCGAHPFTLWRTIHIPMLYPAFLAGWALVFMDTIGDFGLPSALATVYRFPTLPYSIYTAIYTSPTRFDQAGVLSFYLVLILILALLFLFFVMKKARFDFLNSQAVKFQAKETKYSPLLTIGNLSFIAIVIGIPIGSSFFVSIMQSLGSGIALNNFTIHHYVQILQDERFLESLTNSLMIAGFAAFISIVIGFFVSYVLFFTSFKLKGVIQSVSLISLVVPGVVLGIGYIFIWNQKWLEAIHLNLYGTVWIVILAAIAGAIPFAVRLQSGAFAKIPKNMVYASAIQGSGKLQQMSTIILPLAKNSLLIAVLAAFGTSIYDLAIAKMLYPPNYYLLPVTIDKSFEQFNYGYSTAATIVSGAIILAIITTLDFVGKRIFAYLDRKKGE
ncbi:ABC transporter permease [Bacillus horti]|uniref:Iron(III) transport system permease protein n=1 Tax=Caldalkalibacillus horti TaxID=77523 RepID=A0ABT9VXV9_9BACI|nr:ABC transporter permease subunit [Bacillus horti]MDQ0165833.1 iron(III) transport system permease protein [Bacillus horti]